MEWKVPLFEPNLGDAEVRALEEVIRSGWLTMGKKTALFEERFAQFVNCRHAIATNSCTAALHLAIASLELEENDEVICPSLTFVATANAVRYCGARPVFADVASLHDWNINASAIELVLTPRTKAIVVVHYAGYVCDMKPIEALARNNGIAIIEDVAHAPGASRDGKAAGAWGLAGCFSFFSNKNLTTGEGGMVTTNDAELAENIRRMRSHGMTTLTLERYKGHAFSYDVTELGFNYRMSELNAALGLVQLDHVEARNEQRRSLTAKYREMLAEVEGVIIPFASYPGVSACHIMPILLPDYVDRRETMEHLRAAGVQSSIHYRPVDTFTAYQSARLGECDYLYNTHAIGRRVLTLPLFPSMSLKQVEYVCRVLLKALAAAL